ncbi:MAG TPA: elongation factor P [Phycisphaerales bacterium]|nr:elongation factor P [Phycisphaerales bacterium]
MHIGLTTIRFRRRIPRRSRGSKRRGPVFRAFMGRILGVRSPRRRTGGSEPIGSLRYHLPSRSDPPAPRGATHPIANAGEPDWNSSMPTKATDVKKGQFIIWEGQLFQILDTEHVKPGKGPAYIQAKMKNVKVGGIKINRLNSDDRLEEVNVDRRGMQFLYDSGGRGDGPFVFMDDETFDQTEIENDVLPKEQSQWLKENTECVVSMFDGKPLSVALPASIELTVTDTAPQAKGATASNQNKEAFVETGARIRVPPFIENGQAVKVNPETGEYLGKA